MSFIVDDKSINISFDVGEMRRALEARDRLRRRGSERSQHPPAAAPIAPGRAPKLINTLSPKGNFLDIVA